MFRGILFRVCIFWAFGIFSASANPTPLDPSTVIVLANSQVGGSPRLAKSFARMREIPDEQVIVLRMPTTEQISRSQYIQEILNPLRAQLIKRELIDALPGKADEHGIEEIVLIDNPLRYLVTIYGVPLHIANSPEFDDSANRSNYFRSRNARLLELFESGGLARNEASVDAELALALLNDAPASGFIPNPFFGKDVSTVTSDFLKVTRLDGPDAQTVSRLMERTLEAEKEGLKGRAYVDEDARGGNYALGNQMMAQSAKIFSQAGFDLSHDTNRATFGPASRLDAPALYAGWYAGSVNGPFALDGFRFPKGAVATHLHSFSARSLRDPNAGWVAPFISRGASASLGNTAEPYLHLTHHFQFFYQALAAGWSFADAAHAALPAFSWQAIALGDPFYQPFKTTLQDQLDGPMDPADAAANQYIFIRQANLLLAQNQAAEARQILQRGMLKAPGPALAMAFARLLADEEDSMGPLSLDLFAAFSPDSPADAGLFLEMAHMLNELDRPSQAIRILHEILNFKLPQKLHMEVLRNAIAIADSRQLITHSVPWKQQLTLLESPPPDPPSDPPSDK